MCAGVGWILATGTHRGASEKHLQVYLDEFVFRSQSPGAPRKAAFQTLLGLRAARAASTYAEISADIAA